MSKGLRSRIGEKLFRIMQNELLSTLQNSHSCKGEQLWRPVAIHGSSRVSAEQSPEAHIGKDEPA